jgi:ubiquitin C-terminal hydrolase
MIFNGIRNIGNTCYLNCAVQCFIHLPVVFKENSVNSDFINIMKKFCERYYSLQKCDCRELLAYLSKFQSDFQYLALCDAQEALFYLLDLYHENTKENWDDDLESIFFHNFSKNSIEEWKIYSPHYSIISLYFTTQTEEICICQNCNRIIQKRYPIFTNIDICDKEIELINQGVKKEKLEDYKCEECNVQGKCIKITTWNYLSEYIIFYNKKMNFFLKPYIKIPLLSKKKMVEYDLQMTINHNSDHYTTYIKNGELIGIDCDWFLCDDDCVKKIKGNENSLPINTIYLYIFKKVSR